MTEDQREVHFRKLQKLPEWKLEDFYQYLNNKRLKPLLSRQDVKLKPEGDDMVLTRVLGHKKDIPGSGQWQMQV